MDYTQTIDRLENEAYDIYRAVDLKTREIDFRQEELDGMTAVLSAQNSASKAMLRAFFLEGGCKND